VAFTDHSWEDPRFAHFKKARDEEIFVYDFEVARPLVDKYGKGLPLTEAERIYLNGFMDSTVCKQFFCRLNLTFRDNSVCWMNGSPTDEQCSRCETHFRNTGVLKNWAAAQTDQPLVLPDKSAVGMYSTLTDGVVGFDWRFLSKPETFKGIVGSHEPGAQIHTTTPLDRVFPVCLPSLSKSFKGGCNHDCENCPAYAMFDTAKKVLVTGNNTVVLKLEHLKPSLRENLEALAENSVQERAHKEQPHVDDQPDRDR
jgi:hypothetical protein